MSTDESAPAPAPHDRREALREKAQQVHVRQSRARVARGAALTVGATAAVAAIVACVVWAVSSSASRPQLSPENLSGDGFPVASISGAAGAADMQAAEADEGAGTGDEAAPTPEASATPTTGQVEIHVYVDYLSPGAREWQLANATQLTSWVNQGAATLTYHPVSMLTAKSNGTKYSLRAAAASACVATHAPETFYAYNNELLIRQPEVDSDGMTDVELADLAQASGVADPKTVRACIENGDYVSWARKATERAVAGIDGTDDLKLTGTPMVLVNGQAYVGSLTDPAEFSQFVLTTASGAFYKAQTPTPTPTP